MLYPCTFCIALSMDLFVLCIACLTVFVKSLVNQFAIYLGVAVMLLLSIMELFSVVRGALLDRPWSSKDCVRYACDHSVRLDYPSICFVCVCVCRKLSPHLKV